MNIPGSVSAAILSIAVDALAKQASSQRGDGTSEVDYDEFVDDIHQAASKTATEHEGITEELLVLVLESDEVRDSAEKFLNQDPDDNSDVELYEALTDKLSETIGDGIEVDIETVTEDFLGYIQEEIIDDPETWDEMVSLYGEDIAEDLSEFEKEMNKVLFKKIEELQESNSELRRKAKKRFWANILLGVVGLGLTVFSAYLSYLQFF